MSSVNTSSCKLGIRPYVHVIMGSSHPCLRKVLVLEEYAIAEVWSRPCEETATPPQTGSGTMVSKDESEYWTYHIMSMRCVPDHARISEGVLPRIC